MVWDGRALRITNPGHENVRARIYVNRPHAGSNHDGLLEDPVAFDLGPVGGFAVVESQAWAFNRWKLPTWVETVQLEADPACRVGAPLSQTALVSPGVPAGAPGDAVVLYLGDGSARAIAAELLPLAAEHSDIQLIDAGQPSADSGWWANSPWPWFVVDSAIRDAGLMRVDVDAVIVTLSKQSFEGAEADVAQFESEMASVLAQIEARFRNARVVYLTGPTTQFWAHSGVGEPSAHLQSLATVDVADAYAGPMQVLVGPYLWTDPACRRADGFELPSELLADDGVSLTPAAAAEAAQLIVDYLNAHESSRDWFPRAPACTVGEPLSQSTTVTQSGPVDAPSDGVLLYIGHSNGRDMATALQAAAPAVSDLTIVNSGHGSADSSWWANPTAWPWAATSQRLTTSGLAAEDVDVVVASMAKLATATTNADPQLLAELLATFEDELLAILDNVASKYPNVRVVYVVPRITGFWSTGNNAEPSAWLHGQATANALARYSGPLHVILGPYLWTDPTCPRADGFQVTQDMLRSDGIHLTEAGAARVADEMIDYFSSHPSSAGWFPRN